MMCDDFFSVRPEDTHSAQVQNPGIEDDEKRIAELLVDILREEKKPEENLLQAFGVLYE